MPYNTTSETDRAPPRPPPNTPDSYDPPADPGYDADSEGEEWEGSDIEVDEAGESDIEERGDAGGYGYSADIGGGTYTEDGYDADVGEGDSGSGGEGASIGHEDGEFLDSGCECERGYRGRGDLVIVDIVLPVDV